MWFTATAVIFKGLRGTFQLQQNTEQEVII